MAHVYQFILAFLLAYTARMLLYKKGLKTREKKKGQSLAIEMKYLLRKFKLREEKVNTITIARVIAFIDAIIIASTWTLTSIFTDDLVLAFTIIVTLVFLLIYTSYELLGNILKKRGYDKNEL